MRTLLHALLPCWFCSLPAFGALARLSDSVEWNWMRQVKWSRVPFNVAWVRFLQRE
jgi:hypothetical protein